MRFYDTNAMLNLQEEIFEERFVCSSKSFEELEHIKTSANKDGEVKYRARRLCKLLDDHYGEYDVVTFTDGFIKGLLDEYSLADTPDNEIILGCIMWRDSHSDLPVLFVTDDISCKNIARINGLNCESSKSSKEDQNYTGFLEVVMTNEDLSKLYQGEFGNPFGLIDNEYLIVKNTDGETIDTLCYKDDSYRQTFKRPLKSVAFGDKLKPKDSYQACAIDSLMSNTITAISGKAGSGKSLLSLMAAMNLIENGKYDRIVVMFNPTKTRGANDMGFYGGDFVEKAMQNSIGQILTTKFGDRYAVDMLIQQEKIKLVSMADARGMEIRDNEILWITEAQNTSVDLIKLCLSRVSSGAKVFLEGDYMSQTDSYLFEGGKNGLRRVIDAFKGDVDFGYIQLQNAWRSRIAEMTQLL